MKYQVLTLSIAAVFSTSGIAGSLDGGVATDPYSLSVGPSAEATFSGNVAVGPAAKTTIGDSATAVGASSFAGTSSVAVGAGANAYSDKGVSIGAYSTSNGGSPDGGNVAIGYSARIAPPAGGSVTGSVVLGTGSRATESNVVSIGSSGSDSGFGIPQPPLYRRIVNMADGIAESDGATVRQVSAASSAANAAQAAATTAQTGVNNLTTRVTALEASAGIDSAARSGVANITNGTTDLATAKVGSTTVGAVAATADRAETKADAADAKAVAAQTTGNRAEAKADVAQTKANQAWDLGTGLQTRFDDFTSRTGQRLDVLENRMATMSREYRAGIAAAIAGVHSVTAATRAGIGVGVGSFQGQTAIGIGLATDIHQVRVSASIQYGNGATALGAGLAIPVKF